MKRFRFIIGTLIFSVMFNNVMADNAAEVKDIVVVVNKDNPVEAMSRSQIIDLFMGKYVAFPDGQVAVPIDLTGNDSTKRLFYQSLVGMSLARVNSYWSRIRFTGRARPSVKQSTEDDIILYVSETKNAIGYISRSKLTDQVKVVYPFYE